MCGFLGVWNLDRAPVAASDLLRAATELRHRGPDDEGHLLVSTADRAARPGRGPGSVGAPDLPPVEALEARGFDLGLAFRRLSIQDPSPAGRQPMASADGRLWAALNGELYDHLRTRSLLESEGVAFQGHSDTETLLAAWRRWGPDCLDRFEGMWAAALVDLDAGTLHLVRDRFGIKPLYWGRTPSRLVFGSEVRPVAGRLGPTRGDPESLFRYLRFGITDAGERTCFEGVRRVPPGMRLELDLARPADPPRERRYWTLPAASDAQPGPEEAATALRERLLASVGQHLLSDVPVGVALSGGLDSSALAAGMRTVLGPAAEIRAFGFVADDPVLGEERWMDRVARHVGAEIHKVRPQASELVADLPALVASQEEPFGSTSIYAQSRVFRLARASRTPVVLSGQGADEQLGGYRTYLGSRLASLLCTLRLGRATRLTRAVATLPGGDLRGTLLRAGAALVPAWLEPLARRISGEEVVPPWLDAAWFRERGVVPAAPRRGGGRARLRAHLAQSFAETSLPMLLRYEDRSAMAESVESRVPFLVRPVVELLAALPEEHLIDDRARTKSVLRRALAGLLPDDVVDRRDKVGFATPEQRWLAELEPWVREQLEGARGTRVAGLRPEQLLAEWSALRRGGRRFDFRFWRGLNVIAWARALDVRLD